jgi:hypothetical protein
MKSVALFLRIFQIIRESASTRAVDSNNDERILDVHKKEGKKANLTICP